MNQILSTTYLLILLFFLSLFSYYVSGEILRNIQEENTFSTLETLNINDGERLELLLHLNLAKVYTKRKIRDAAIYELQFLINSANGSYPNKILSNLYRLIGQNFEGLQDYNESVKFYSKAITVWPDNAIAIKELEKLTSKNSQNTNS
nr:Ycf37 [Porphyrostromium japonicum]